MALKGGIIAGSVPGIFSPEKRRFSRAKKEKSKVQSVWDESTAKPRDRYPLPSLHLRISLTDISKPWLGKWSQARRGGSEHIQVVRTKSQAGMLRPRRLPTIYKSNSRLFIDSFENPVPEQPKLAPTSAESEKQPVTVDLPERGQLPAASPSSEKHSVIVGMPNGIEITLSPRIEQVEHMPSRFEELNDDASVHELEAVYHTTSTPPDETQPSRAIVLCEADDPTALTALEILQRSFTMGLKQHRPKISLSIPRSKSLHVPADSRAPDTAMVISPPSPPSSTTLYRSLTQLPVLQCSIISPLTPIDMPRPMRPYSTISVPLFMEVSELVQCTEDVLPLPTAARYISDMEEDESANVEHSPRHHQPLAQGSHVNGGMSKAEDDALSSSSSTPSLVTDNEDYNDHPTEATGTNRKKLVVDSINKPLPPEPQLAIPTVWPPLAYKVRQLTSAQSHTTLPRSRYSPTHRGNLDDFRKLNSATNLSLDEAIEELEWRLSTICEHRAQMSGPRPRTPVQVSRGLGLMQPSRMPPSIPHPVGGNLTTPPRTGIVRSASVNHIILQSRSLYDQKKSRSCQDLNWKASASEDGEAPMGEESETWYRTASERSSAYLSHSIFSDAGTDGTCQTEQSNVQERAKDKIEMDTDKECVIHNLELPQAMQSCGLPAEVAELVVLRIMSNLSTLKDLFATAALNRGFYNTFKRHEMYLIKATLFKASKAAWELREMSEGNQLTPTAYLQQYSVEIYTMGMLKSLILVQCESFLRPSTITGLVGTNEERSGEIDAAFWRVWTFCRLFGGTAGEDEDAEAQVDWLNGGQLVRQREPGTSFGLGNGDGLSTKELYDMIEIWTCLSVLVQTFHGRIGEARAAGIYENCKVDTKRDEELVLEEWTCHLLTLGPSCILALAPGSFATAKELNLTQWTPPTPGPESGRRKFFKEALTRVYEARLVEEAKAGGKRVKRASKTSSRMTPSDLAREIDRARQSDFAKELRHQRQHSPSKSEPWTFSDERPMSVYSQVVKALPHGASRISAQDLAAMPKHPLLYSTSRPDSTGTATTALPRPQTPVLTSSSALPFGDDEFPVDLSGMEMAHGPIITIEEIAKEVADDVARVKATIVDPVDSALAHLVNVLGVGREDAKWALTRSENGHGVDVDRAIDILHNGSPAASRSSSRQENQYPVEVESASVARSRFMKRRSPVRILQQRDSIVTTDEMTEKEKERANIMRMREKSYRVLGIGQPQAGGKKSPSSLAKRFSRR